MCSLGAHNCWISSREEEAHSSSLVSHTETLSLLVKTCQAIRALPVTENDEEMM
ncbi:MAG: hypothetical protein ACSLEN_03160 [Candidatus Malihini olakiniferum]